MFLSVTSTARFTGIRKLCFIALLFFFTLLITACGGGGGGSDTSTTGTASITLNGENPVILSAGEMYIEQGALATDANDTPLDVTTLSAVTQSVGDDFSITYKATDAQGNTVSVTRRVFVGADVSAPSIMLSDANTLIVPVAASFTDPGAQFSDNRDALDALVTSDLRNR